MLGAPGPLAVEVKAMTLESDDPRPGSSKARERQTPEFGPAVVATITTESAPRPRSPMRVALVDQCRPGHPADIEHPPRRQS